MVRCTAQEGQEPKEQCPALPRTALLSRRTGVRKRIPPRLPPHRSFPAFSLFPPHGFLNPWKAERIFPTLKESTRHFIALEGRTSMPSLTHPVGQRGLGTKWKDVLETTSRNLSVHIPLKTSSLD